MTTTSVVVGRQAIQDRAGDIVGYELLFRRDADAVSADSSLDDAQMTAEVLFSAMTVGLEHLAGDGFVWCNADRAVLTGAIPVALPPERTVIEILETVELDAEVIAGCRRLRARGFRIALDDWVWTQDAEAMLDLVDIVKIDVLATADTDLDAIVARCRAHDVVLVAEKIETEAVHRRCLDLGFDLFQGYWLERSVVVSGWTLEPGTAVRLHTAVSMLGEELDIDELHRLVQSDAALSFQVMRLASLGRPGQTRRRITGVRDAIVLAGTRRTQNWIALLLARASQPAGANRLTDALTRAKAVQVLAERAGRSDGDAGFAAGLLSALNLIVGVSVAQLRETLVIDDELAEAAFGDRTSLGRLVTAAAAFQQGRSSDAVDELCLENAFARAFGWATTLQDALDDEPARSA